MSRHFVYAFVAMAVGIVSPQHSALALNDNTVYKNHAEVRAHQFVETWTVQLPTGDIHVRAHCSNAVGGIASLGRAAFTPEVTLSFRDDKGAKLGDIVLRYVCNEKDTWVDQVITGRSGLWSAALIHASAAEVYDGRTGTQRRWDIPIVKGRW